MTHYVFEESRLLHPNILLRYLAIFFIINFEILFDDGAWLAEIDIYHGMFYYQLDHFTPILG